MIEITPKEKAELEQIQAKLEKLKLHLNSVSLAEPFEVNQWYKCLADIKAIQGNSSNDSSFLSCLMAKIYLSEKFDLTDFDIADKPQGAPGLDIDVLTKEAKRIIGEIKTTVPYHGAKNDLGAKQKETFRHDFEKLNRTPADYKFFFVTEKATFDIVQRRYAKEIPDVEIVLLTK
jgi:hypothetical protein